MPAVTPVESGSVRMHQNLLVKKFHFIEKTWAACIIEEVTTVDHILVTVDYRENR